MPNKLESIFANGSQEAIIAALKEKTITVPVWFGGKGLQMEYNPKMHPVMNKALYPDVVKKNGQLEKVTRVTYDLQRLAVKRMTELCNGIPVKRIYNAENDNQKAIAGYIEAILTRNRINSVNIERNTMLFASCEVMTLWYATEENNNLYGFNSPLKLRCRNFSPMQGDELYPLFDEYGDMIAMSVAYNRKVAGRNVSFFDTYTADRHMKWSNEGGSFSVIEDEEITLMKIPAIYVWRPTPIWEDTSTIVFEMEWAMSRNGNYLRRNSKPIFAVFADEQISYGNENDSNNESLSIVQYPKGSNAGYITWQQAVENLKFYIAELRQYFFTQLQLPDWSYESMKASPMSGESRKQLFIDCQLKVKDESGRLLEFYDREINVIKAFLKVMLPKAMHKDIDALGVEVEITPFSISDDKDTITNLLSANGNKPLMSQRESIEYLGWSEDVERTMNTIAEEKEANAMDMDSMM